MKKWIALLLALVMCLLLCACGANSTKQDQERNDGLSKAVETANYVLKDALDRGFNTWFDIDGDYNTSANVYTVSVSYDTEAIEEWVISENPNTKTLEGLRKEYIKASYKTLKEDTLDSLMTYLKQMIGNIFTDELGTEVVYQFTDEAGNITTY